MCREWCELWYDEGCNKCLEMPGQQALFGMELDNAGRLGIDAEEPIRALERVSL